MDLVELGGYFLGFWLFLFSAKFRSMIIADWRSSGAVGKFSIIFGGRKFYFLWRDCSHMDSECHLNGLKMMNQGLNQVMDFGRSEKIAMVTARGLYRPQQTTGTAERPFLR